MSQRYKVILAALFVVVVVTGLILNGLVEYNFADGELVITYWILLGIAGRKGDDG